MSNFTKKLMTDFGFAVFIFNRIYTVEGLRYYISVNDYNYNSYFFRMKAIGGKWIIGDKNVPEWILSIQKELSDSIIEHKSKGDS